MGLKLFLIGVNKKVILGCVRLGSQRTAAAILHKGESSSCHVAVGCKPTMLL